MQISDDEFKEPLERILAMSQSDVLLDSNIIRSGEERRFWEDKICRTLVTSETVEEVRSRPEMKLANKFVADCISRNRVWSRERCPYPTAHDVLTACAEKLCPAIHERLVEEHENSGKPTDLRTLQVMVERAVQAVLNESPELFSTPKHRMALVQREMMPNEYTQISPSVKKAWRKYYQKRLKKKFYGEYKYADERLAAIAMTNAILCNRISVVVSADYDLQVIFKQLTDNVLCCASLKGDSVDAENFKALTAQVDTWRQIREVQSLAKYFTTVRNLDALLPVPGDIVLVNQRQKELFTYYFPEKFRLFLLKVDSIGAQSA